MLLDLEAVSFVDLAGLRVLLRSLVTCAERGSAANVTTGRALRHLAARLGVRLNAIAAGEALVRARWGGCVMDPDAADPPRRLASWKAD